MYVYYFCHQVFGVAAYSSAAFRSQEAAAPRHDLVRGDSQTCHWVCIAPGAATATGRPRYLSGSGSGSMWMYIERNGSKNTMEYYSKLTLHTTGYSMEYPLSLAHSYIHTYCTCRYKTFCYCYCYSIATAIIRR